ncbi:HNH endonuclease signature motif containing protein [Nitriliruptor alkaliphilus]|uniref:HNH endonuclease signature motif containing protein n=1 Tax=Nitriliruptor alkaliphilus TaxID=427918 RepID=UPI00146FD782|nr:HNH endonuclease signature motif containing protein [Nitriliruptor alkaliphilus]
MSAPAAASHPVSRRVHQGYRRGRRGDTRWLAAEPGASYRTSGSAANLVAGSVAGGGHLAAIASGVTGLSGLDVDSYSAEELGELAAAVQVQIDALTVVRDRIAGALRRRAVLEAGPGRERKAVRQATRQLGDRLGLSPSEAKQASERGKVLQDRPHLALAATGAPTGSGPDPDAIGAGEGAGGRGLRPEQIAVIGRILAEVPLEHTDRVEAELLAAARTQHAVELGRTARRLLARLDADAANAAEERRHRRRRCSIVQTADGMTRISGEFAGLDAEVVNAAPAAFATPDLPGEPARTPEQRTADGLVAALRAALDAGSAPADRGVKPHVVVLVPLGDPPEPTDDTGPGTDHPPAPDGTGHDDTGPGDTGPGDTGPGADVSPGNHVPGVGTADGTVHAPGLADLRAPTTTDDSAGPAAGDDAAAGAADDQASPAAGDQLGPVAELAWTGPIPTRQIRRLLADAHIRLLGIDLQGVPIAMTRAVEQPTQALYLALVARDGGCRYPGCDAPPAWCDVAHATARRDRGPLTIHNALLLCRHHHRKLDLGRWTITIDGTDATFTRPGGRSIRAGPARGRPPDTS